MIRVVAAIKYKTHLTEFAVPSVIFAEGTILFKAEVYIL
jgi:hypothetical protein